MNNSRPQDESNFATASAWWSDLPNIWTPVGWRDHLCRFSVLWNGVVLAHPSPNRRTAQWAGQGLQLAIEPSPNAEPPSQWTVVAGSRQVDDGMVRQGWLPDEAPVLWTEWAQDGLALRSEMFAHVPGGRDVERGDEPLFAWLRLRIHDLCHPLPMETDYGFLLRLQSLHVATNMSLRNFTFLPGTHTYPRALHTEIDAPAPADGCRMLEPDGRVRLAVAPGDICNRVQFFQPDEKLAYHRLYVQLPVRQDAYVDLLLPMLPCDREVFEAELALGFDDARSEARRFWTRHLATPTRFETPEDDVNDTMRQSVRFSLNLTEKNPATGKYCKVNGSWIYADLWTTPGAMDCIMLLDTLGYHDTVTRYLDIFQDEQGTVTPPGDGYEAHPGYLSTPALYKSIDWLSDNGAVLWTICRHALLSGDATFTEQFTDCIVKSCEWIKAMRARTGHGGYDGVLPPAVATDAKTCIQSVWSAGWNHLGLCAAVRVLQRIGHARAAEFAAEAQAYREDYVTALRDKCRRMPTWQDAAGRVRQFVPTALTGDEAWESRHGFYLDTGPLFHVFSGLLPADDPLMQDTLAWFREGPQQRFYRRDANCFQVPVLDHEMSSCEPAYSWNNFHAWQLGDRAAFLEGMYSLFAGAVSRKTRISCETRGGITGNVFAAPLAIYLARLAVIDDQLVDGELHLLRLLPPAWIAPSTSCRFEAVPTEYGPVTLTTHRSQDGGTLTIRFEPAFRKDMHAPRVILHVPSTDGLATIMVNGMEVAGQPTCVLSTAKLCEK